MKISKISKPVVESWEVQQEKRERQLQAYLERLTDEERSEYFRKKEEAEAIQGAKREQERIAYDAAQEEWLKENGEIYPDEFEASARFSAFTMVEDAKKKGKVIATTSPYWIDPFDLWLLQSEAQPLAKLPTAGRLKIPLAIKGGSVTVTLESVKRDWNDGTIHTSLEYEWPISGRIDGHFFSGTFEKNFDCEMYVGVVRLNQDIPQEIVERIARMFDTIIHKAELPDDLSALLAHSDRCFKCKRPLSDEVSKTILLGPSCAKELGIPHNAEVARIVASKRASLGIVCEVVN